MQRRSARRTASWLFLGALAVALVSGYIALVYHGDLDAGAELVIALDFGVWIAIFSVAEAALMVGLLLIFLVPLQVPAPAPEEAAAEAPPPLPELYVTCAQCSQSYTVPDSGERPLTHLCPNCGKENVTEAPVVEAQPEPEVPMEDVDAEPETPGIQPTIVRHRVKGKLQKFLVLKCGNCQTQFETPYTEERPLITQCTNCGRKGILKAPS